MIAASTMGVYRDSLSLPLAGPPPSMETVIVTFFRASPVWLDALMALRNALVRPLGLKTGPIGEKGLRPPFVVGQSIGLFRIIALNDSEVVFGEDDRHLDFRITVRVTPEGSGPTLTLASTVTPHNRMGRIYLALVLPFHRRIVPMVAKSMARTLSAPSRPSS